MEIQWQNSKSYAGGQKSGWALWAQWAQWAQWANGTNGPNGPMGPMGQARAGPGPPPSFRAAEFLKNASWKKLTFPFFNLIH